MKDIQSKGFVCLENQLLLTSLQGISFVACSLHIPLPIGHSLHRNKQMVMILATRPPTIKALPPSIIILLSLFLHLKLKSLIESSKMSHKVYYFVYLKCSYTCRNKS